MKTGFGGEMEKWDKQHLRSAITAAQKAREHGNHPFGALLADQNGKVLLTAENTVTTEDDPTGHAETNLVRQAAKRYPREFLADCTLYASTEPCPMCAGAIFWGNIGRVVYGLSQGELYKIIGEENREVLDLACRMVLSHGKKQVNVIGPMLEDEARSVHLGFWNV